MAIHNPQIVSAGESVLIEVSPIVSALAALDTA